MEKKKNDNKEALLFDVVSNPYLMPSEYKGRYTKNGGLTKFQPRKWTEKEIEWVMMLKEKYITNAMFIADADINSVLDVFSGSKSAYESYELERLVTNDIEISFNTDYNYDALTFCCMQYAGRNKYDLVDLDPFGSAYDCFDLAIKMAKKGIIITLGELGHKRFKRLDFVRRYYGIETLDDFTTENLVKHIIKIGERNKKTLIPVYVKDWRNIARVYFKIEELKITEQWEK